MKQHVQQEGIQFDGILKAGYELEYSYANNPFQISNLKDDSYRTESDTITNDVIKRNHAYEYDANGNLVYVNTLREKQDGSGAGASLVGRSEGASQEKKLRWDEENRLQSIYTNGFIAGYWYDAAGERVIKTSGDDEGIYVNDVFSGGRTETADFTAYINPYLVVSKGGSYTKHIYIGSQRIVSKLGDLDSYGQDPRRIEYAGSNVDGAKVDYDAKYAQSQQAIKDNYANFEVPYYGTDNDDYVNGEGFCCDNTKRLKSFDPSQNDNPELFQYYYHSDHLGSTSLITNLDGEVVQHVEYIAFGEVFIEELNNQWNTPYLFNSKELDPETSLYYYGARYYDPRTSVWLSVDALATYNPFEKENFIDGQHNGGVYNSFNLNVYSYCYQNPVKLVDPNGKQTYGDIFGMNQDQWRSYCVNSEAEKVAAHAAKPAAISIPLSLSFFGVGFTGFSLTPTWILKGPDQGFHLFGSASFGLNADSGNGGNIGLMAYWLKGDERSLTRESFAGKSDDYSLGYKFINADYSTFGIDDKGSKMEGFGLSLSSPRSGPKKLQFLNPSLEIKRTLTFDVVDIFSKANKNEEQKPKTKESTNHYYLRTLTNFPASWYENQ